MASLLEIAQAMRDIIGDAVAGADFAVQVDAFRNLNPTPPSIDIYPADPFAIDEADGFGDINETFVWTVRARIAAGDVDAGQDFLLSLMDPIDALSISTALTADTTLAGTVSSLTVQGPSGHRVYEDAAHMAAFLGVDWTVKTIRDHS